jgi:hypothetical protein
MIEPKEVERLRRHLVALTAKADDTEALAIIQAMQDEWSTIIAAQARKLNSEGVSWAEIGDRLGIKRTTAHMRYAGTPSTTGYRSDRTKVHPQVARSLDETVTDVMAGVAAHFETGVQWRSSAEGEWDHSR